MNKLLAYACAALLAACVVLGYGLRHQLVENGALGARAEGAEKALKRAQEDLIAERAVLARRDKEIASNRLQSRQAQEALQKALQAAPAWAGTDVPPEVQKALSEAVEGLE